MPWKLSAFSDEGGSAVDAQISALLDAELKFIDIRSVAGVNIVELPVDDAHSIKQKLDSAGIVVSMFGSPIGKIDITEDFQIDLARLDHLARLAPILECFEVRIFSYYNSTQISNNEWSEIALARLIELRERARELGLVLYHENERDIFGDMLENVQTIGKAVRDGKAFKTIFDFDNYTQGGQSAWVAWLAVKADVDAIHLKDSLNRQHVPVGLGDGFVEAILKDALESGWNGPLSIEPHLSHSGAVAATGPSGIENQSFKDMTDRQRFLLACGAATNLLKKIDAPIV